MKPQEGELVNEISKLQCMVSELKTGFTSALLELSQIQHGDTYLREELEENRRSCQKKARRMEGLVESLKEELVVMRCQILQLCGTNRQRRQEGKGSTSKQKESDAGGAAGGRSQCECSSGSSASPSRGKVLLHCYLQGLKAGLSEGTDARHQVAMQLLHSEWEYVSTLNQLYDKYKTPPILQVNLEPYQTYLRFVEQLLQRHLIFRNTLQERLSAEHWKSLVGDILVQLIGQNDSSFTDMYLGYTTTLATFLSLEFSRIKQTEKTHKKQSGQEEREELNLLSLLLAPVSRIHSYLSHIQSLLQWTGKEHPDCSLLLGTEKALRNILSRCHLVLEEDVRWDEEADRQSCSGAPLTCPSSAKCGARSQRTRTRDTQPLREEACGAAQRDDQQPAHLANGCLTPMHLQCWSRSPVRRKSCMKERTATCPSAHDCGLYHGDVCSLLGSSEPRGWGENSDSGQGTSSQPAGKGASEETPRSGRSPDDCETDPDDTSAFDYSSVTSCSPDGTLRTGAAGSQSGEEDEDEEEEDTEEDSEVPVLLKPSYTQQQRDAPRERTVCLRWQIPRLTPHPPRTPAGLRVEAPTPGPGPPCPAGSYGKRLVSIKKGSPQLHPKSAFRPIWDEPALQGDAAPEKESRQGFLPVQATGGRQTFQKFSQSRENLRPGPHHPGGLGSGAVWEDSEDSEGPCSTV